MVAAAVAVEPQVASKKIVSFDQPVDAGMATSATVGDPTLGDLAQPRPRGWRRSRRVALEDAHRQLAVARRHGDAIG